MLAKLLVLMFLLFLVSSESYAKACKKYSSCAQVIADYPNGNFGRRDGDNDGIPCENVCRSKKQVNELLKRYSN